MRDVASIEIREDNGFNRGLVNWFVTGRASSAEGVRLNAGGEGRISITTTDNKRYTVVVVRYSRHKRLSGPLSRLPPGSLELISIKRVITIEISAG